MKKVMFICLTMALIFAPLVFAGGGRQGGSGASGAAAKLGETPVTVQFWNSWTGGDGDTLVAIVEEFNRTNPWKITIEMDIVQGSTLTQKLSTSLPAGEAAELLLQGTDSRFRYQEWLQPINDIWTNTDLKEADFMKNYLDLFKIGNDLYGIPFQNSAMFLYWNKDLFSRYGLDPDKPPMSVEEWTAMAARLTDPVNKVYGSGLFYKYGGQINSIMQTLGGLAITEPLPGKYKVNFVGNEGFRKYLKWEKDLYDRGINPLEENVDPMFRSNQIGIMVNGGWLAADARKGNVNFEMAKIFDTDPKGSLSGFVITSSAKTPLLKQAAEKFIQWWYTGNDGRNLARTGNGRWAFEIGFTSTYLPLINSPEYQANTRLNNLTSSNVNGVLDIQVPASFKGSIDSIIGALSEEVIFSDARGDAAINRAIDTALANAQQDAEDVVIEYHGAAALIR
jgi:multiple sugar transport system substrate-binding protein